MSCVFPSTTCSIQLLPPHRGIGAAGCGAAGLWQRVETVVLVGPQHRLQRLDVADGVAQDLHLWQPLVGARGRAAFQCLKGIVDFAEPPPFSHGRCFASVGMRRLPLAGLAGPQQAVTGLVEAPGGPNVLVLRLDDGNVPGATRLLGPQQCQPRVQVLKEVHVAGAEAGVIIEVVHRGESEGQVGWIHRLQRPNSILLQVEPGDVRAHKSPG